MLRTPPNISPTQQPSRSESDIQKLCIEQALTPEFTAVNLIQRSKRRRSSDEHTDSITELRTDLMNMIKELVSSQNTRLDKLETHILDIKTQYVKIEESNRDIEKSVTYVSDQLTAIEEKISKLESERNKIAEKMCSLEGKIDFIDYNLIKTCVEMRNVPKIRQENKNMLYDLVHRLSKEIGMEIQMSDIRDISRLPSKKESRVSSISVEFTNTLLKNNFLTSVKQFNNKNTSSKINSTHLGLDVPRTPVYIAEQLTPYSKKLFYAARNFCKANAFTFCWTSNGRVLIKKSSDTQYIVIRTEQQLQQLSLRNNNNNI